MHLAPRRAPLARHPGILQGLAIPWAAASLLALGLASAPGCIPPELLASAGAGAGTGAGSGTGGLAGSGVGGGSTAGGAGGTIGLCEDLACADAGGVCQNGACTYSCLPTGACSTKIYCPQGMPCRVECDGAETCSGGVDCTLSTSCQILCNGANSCGKAPNVGTIDCPLGEANCKVWCEEGACTTVIVKAGVSGADVVCEGLGSCQDLSCQGFCNVTCGADNACKKVACTGGPCSIGCGATATCNEVICGGGACTVACGGMSSCPSVTCDAACACDVTCAMSACGTGAICPGDVSGAGPCSLDNGCSSGPSECSTCP